MFLPTVESGLLTPEAGRREAFTDKNSVAKSLRIYELESGIVVLEVEYCDDGSWKSPLHGMANGVAVK